MHTMRRWMLPAALAALFTLAGCQPNQPDPPTPTGPPTGQQEQEELRLGELAEVADLVVVATVTGQRDMTPPEAEGGAYVETTLAVEEVLQGDAVEEIKVGRLKRPATEEPDDTLDFADGGTYLLFLENAHRWEDTWLIISRQGIAEVQADGTVRFAGGQQATLDDVRDTIGAEPPAEGEEATPPPT